MIMRVSIRGGESFLIGRQPVWNDERDLVVVSSAAQQAIEWRLATEEDPGDLLLRREPAFQRRKPRTVYPSSTADPRMTVALPRSSSSPSEQSMDGGPQARLCPDATDS